MFFKKDQGQIAPLLIIVVIVVILAIGATAVIGELGYQKVRLTNSVDSALVSSAADLARALNLVRQTSFMMLLNHYQIQAMLLARGIWPNKSMAYQYAFNVAYGLNQSREMYEQAKEIIKDSPKDLRTSLIDRIMPSTIDELKPYVRKPSGELDIQAYLDTKMHFDIVYLNYKKNHKDNWYLNNLGNNHRLSYSWNKTINPEGSLEPFTEGSLVVAGRPVLTRNNRDYDSYFEMTMVDAPTSVKIKSQPWLLFFLYKCECSPTGFCPGFFPNPWYRISRVTIEPSKRFGVVVQKLPFRKFAYFVSGNTPARQKEIRHRGKVAITGSLSTGYDIKLEPISSSDPKYAYDEN